MLPNLHSTGTVMYRPFLLICLAAASEVCLLQTENFLQRDSEPTALTTSLLAAQASSFTELADELDAGDGATDFLDEVSKDDSPTSPWSFMLPVETVATGLRDALGHSLRKLRSKKRNVEYTKFQFVHVPKTAGTSLVKDVKDDATFQGHANWELTGLEWCLPPHFKTNSDVMNMMMFRSPRAHVFSQYLECKYDWWGKIVTNNTNFPRDSDDVTGFNEWIEHFQVGADDSSTHCSCDVSHWQTCECMKAADYNCYNPHNMQARALTCTGDSSVHSHHVFEDTGLIPSQHDALSALGKLQWTGILELYDESLCLFFYEATGELRDHCQCGLASADTHHIAHSVPPHSVDDLSDKTIEMVDAVTTVDRTVYRAAVLQFLRELRKVEQAEDVKILCGAKLEGLRNSTSYIEGMESALLAHGVFGAGLELSKDRTSD